MARGENQQHTKTVHHETVHHEIVHHETVHQFIVSGEIFHFPQDLTTAVFITSHFTFIQQVQIL